MDCVVERLLRGNGDCVRVLDLEVACDAVLAFWVSPNASCGIECGCNRGKARRSAQLKC